MSPDLGNRYGCELHCLMCTAGAAVDPSWGTAVFAHRWLRPRENKESRNARGGWEFVESGAPEEVAILVPANSGNMELAPCWENFGVEYFDKADGEPYTLCDCFAGANQCQGELGTKQFLRAESSTEGSNLLCTCWAFERGFDWPPRINCTGVGSPNGPIRVRFRSTFLFNAGLIHLGDKGEDGSNASNHCTPNAAVGCYGHLESGGGVCAPSGFDAEGFYNESTRRDFEAMMILGMNATFGGESPEITLKNKLMAFIKADGAEGGIDVFKMRQMDSRRRHHSASDNDNFDLPAFRRSYNLDGGDTTDTVEFSNFHRIAPFGNDAENPLRIHEYTIESVEGAKIPQTAISDVTLNITALGTFGVAGYEHVTIQINDVNVGGLVFYAIDALECQPVARTVTILADTWNNNVMTDENGDPRTTINVKVKSIAVDADGCGLVETFLEMTIAYTGQITHEGPRPFAGLSAIETLTGRMRKSGHEINGEWVLVDAQMYASVHLHRVNRNNPIGPQTQLHAAYPLVVIRLRIHMGMRISAADIEAFNAAGHTLEGSPLTIRENYAPDDNFVDLEDDVDEIEWFDSEGEFVRPPSMVVWRGHQGWTSDPQTHSVGATCQIINTLFGGPIRGMASHRNGNPGERHNVWQGDIDLKFGIF